ncbi:hypothetical protein SS50377_24693 [Spironucleus salmonicida]|uniref:Uncharacterized protein n=1 Tax=Spironucleus salmonicida TaxID=348837 RepID=V6LL86_9EUKA|nr:hypothetical protein SS50377_24693 [Spironucleus salmonicida]|eukprot:EST44501.1 Hypothetical protein SS50377_15498 [Spironucleus salmonicida]
MSGFDRLPKSCQNKVIKSYISPQTNHQLILDGFLDKLDRQLIPLNPNSPFEPRLDSKQINDPVLSINLELEKKRQEAYDARPKFDFQKNPYGRIRHKKVNYQPATPDNQKRLLHNDYAISAQLTTSQNLRCSLEKIGGVNLTQSMKLRKVQCRYLDRYEFNKKIIRQEEQVEKERI